MTQNTAPDWVSAAEAEQNKAALRAEKKQKKKEKRAEAKRRKQLFKAEKKAKPKKYGSFTVTKNFFLYLCFFVFAVIFTQALRSPLSSELLILVLLLLPLLLLYSLLGIVSVRQSCEVEAETVQKETPVGYSILLSNDGFLPFPFVEADVRYPASDGVHCDTKRVFCSLAPHGVFAIEDKAVFHYRGGYEIGVEDIYVCDFFRMFRVRIRQDNLRPVFVMPRRIVLTTDGVGAASDINTTEVRNMRGSDRTEMTEIKEYQSGDGMRDVHWKLSSKTQDLMVKHYGMNACRSIYYLPDMAAGYTDPLEKGLYDDDINLFCADAVTEMTIALVLSALREEGNICTMLWYDRRAEQYRDMVYTENAAQKNADSMGYAAEVLYNELDFERVYPYFATVSLHDASYDPVSLCRFATETDGASYCIVTARLDDRLLETLQSSVRDYATVLQNGGIHVYFFSPANKIRDEETRTRYLDDTERRIGRLRAAGLLVDVFNSL